jgi:hypothetical protein
LGLPRGHDYVYEFVPENEVWIDDAIEEKRGAMCFSMNCTSAIEWPVVGRTTKPMLNPAASNIAAAITPTNSMEPWQQKVGSNISFYCSGCVEDL